MMTDRQFNVVLYASEDNDVRCKESVTCITKEKQVEFGFDGHASYNTMRWNHNDPMWGHFNENAIKAIKDRIFPSDIVCLIGGNAQTPIAEAFQSYLCVEFGIGYEGIMASTHHVFESYAWMHYVYGYNHYPSGIFFDDVIPNSFEIERFTTVKEPQDYFAFVGRLDANKGLNIAQQICEELGAELRIAGIGEPRGYGTFLGLQNSDEIADLMSNAKALLVPTQYIGPFEGVHIEAQLHGTPVITTDYGVFTETVVNGRNGYRCRMFREFLEAARKAPDLDREVIAGESRIRFGTKTVSKQYKTYFDRLSTLHGDGWYAK